MHCTTYMSWLDRIWKPSSTCTGSKILGRTFVSNSPWNYENTLAEGEKRLECLWTFNLMVVILPCVSSIKQMSPTMQMLDLLRDLWTRTINIRLRDRLVVNSLMFPSLVKYLRNCAAWLPEIKKIAIVATRTFMLSELSVIKK